MIAILIYIDWWAIPTVISMTLITMIISKWDYLRYWKCYKEARIMAGLGLVSILGVWTIYLAACYIFKL